MRAPLPSFGLVQALPHEFLVHVRQGRVVAAAQGGSCFKRPGDAVARVDMRVRRLQFSADQITRERLGVQVTGLAVFRVARPLLAWRMLDLDDPEAIEGILTQMFVGATRRLVANLDLEACLTRRKEALASELMAEVGPVLAGRGRVDDDVDQGWGVALDTIEIQDVRVLSAEVFERLQAPCREGLELSALRARAEVAAERARLAEEVAREEERRRRERLALEEARVEAERRRAVAAAEHQEALARAALEARLAREAAEAEAAGRRERARVEAALAMEERRAASELARAELRARAARVEGEARVSLLRQEREAQDHVSEARLRELALTHTLPEVTRAWRGSFDKVVLTGPGDAGFLTRGLAEALATLQAFGVSLPGAGQAE